MNNNRKLSSIQVTAELKDYLKSLGKKGQSYEDIIKEILKTQTEVKANVTVK